MPEGHTIHRLALDITRAFAGRKLKVTSPQGRFLSAELLDGQLLARAHAIGKHLFLDFETSTKGAAAINHCVHIHLGLFGKFKKVPKERPPSDTVRLRLQDEDACWQLTGPTACALVDDEALAALRERLGADPLSDAPRSPRTWAKVHASKRSIGALLLDQSVFAGIGNVYRAEILFLLGVHPETPGNAIPKPVFEKLWRLSRTLLLRGVKANRIVTVVGANRTTPRRETLYVYKQRYCRVCRVPVLKSTNATRTMYHCQHCQPLRTKDVTLAEPTSKKPSTPKKRAARRPSQ
jgi:endonuclease VIII